MPFVLLMTFLFLFQGSVKNGASPDLEQVQRCNDVLLATIQEFCA
jgi:hypothetical protein